MRTFLFVALLMMGSTAYAQEWTYIVNPFDDYETMCVAPDNTARGSWTRCGDGTCNNAPAIRAQCAARYTDRGGRSGVLRVPLNREGATFVNCVAKFGMTKVAAVCTAGALTLAELNKCFESGIGGRGCFGDNNTLVGIIHENWQAAEREPNAFQQHFRATTGVSIEDIRRHGPLGGQNSDARAICNGIARVFGGRC